MFDEDIDEDDAEDAASSNTDWLDHGEELGRAPRVELRVRLPQQRKCLSFSLFLRLRLRLLRLNSLDFPEGVGRHVRRVGRSVRAPQARTYAPSARRPARS